MVGPGHVRHHGRGELVIEPSKASDIHIGRFRDCNCPKDDAFPERRRGVLV